MAEEDESDTQTFKVIVIGEPAVGKTSVIQRYVNGQFRKDYQMTIGVDFSLKIIQMDKTLVHLQLWDIAGQDRFSSLTRVFFKDASAACIVFDITSRKSFEKVADWKNEVDTKVHKEDGKPIPSLLVANKCDMEKECQNPVTEKEIDECTRQLNFIGWRKTSAKTNYYIDDAMKMLVSHMLQNEELPHSSGGDSATIHLDGKPAPQQQPVQECGC